MNVKDLYLERYGEIISEESNGNDLEVINAFEENNVAPYIEDEQGKEQMLQEINRIMDYMEFDRIHKAMVALDWKWRDNPESPTVDELKEKLLDMLCELFENQCNTISHGGFTVGYNVLRPEYGEPNDFEHCVEVFAYFAIDEYHTFW